MSINPAFYKSSKKTKGERRIKVNGQINRNRGSKNYTPQSF